MSREQQNEPVQDEAATSVVESQPALSAEEEKQKNAEQFQKSMAEAKKLAAEHKFDEASDLFSEAAHLAKLIYGELSPDSFEAYYLYGDSLLNLATDIYAIVRNDDLEESSSDESEDEEATDEPQVEGAKPSKEGDKAAEDVEMSQELGETFSGRHRMFVTEEVEQADQSEQAEDLNKTLDFDAQVPEEDEDDEEPDALEEILVDAAGTFEIAGRVCDSILQNSAIDEEVKKVWNLRFGDVHSLLGQVHLLNDQPHLAKEAFNKALTILKKYLSDEDRKIASLYFDLAKAEEAEGNYDECKVFYGKALSSLEGAASKSSDEQEVTLLKALCADVQEKLKEIDETAALAQEFTKQATEAVKKALPSIDETVAASDDGMARKRTRESGAAETSDFKKSRAN